MIQDPRKNLDHSQILINFQSPQLHKISSKPFHNYFEIFCRLTHTDIHYLPSGGEQKLGHPTKTWHQIGYEQVLVCSVCSLWTNEEYE